VWHRLGLLTAHDQARDPEGAIDLTPLIAVEVEHDKQITREKRGFDRGQFSGVTNRLLPFWHKGAEALVFEISVGVFFPGRKGVYRKPSLAFGECERGNVCGDSIGGGWLVRSAHVLNESSHKSYYPIPNLRRSNVSIQYIRGKENNRVTAMEIASANVGQMICAGA
jgi:hypothetical protein